MSIAAVRGAFDDVRSRHFRFLQEASRRGTLHVYLDSDAAILARTGAPPHFSQEERAYLLGAIRGVERVSLAGPSAAPDALPVSDGESDFDAWIVEATDDTPEKQAFCRKHRIDYRVVPDGELSGFPDPIAGTGSNEATSNDRPGVVVTGCFDWLHSGHVRFFEEAAEWGDLTVVVGHDANIRHLKGEGHPLYPAEERRYMTASIRTVARAMISTGFGWLDAEPEIDRIRPAIYAVNEDGDRPEKRAFCAERGIRYVVMKRAPREGLPPRRSTDLRGF